MSGNRPETWRERAQRRIAERQFERIAAASAEDLKPRGDIADLGAQAFAVLILITPLVVAALGIWIIVWSGFAVVGTIIGLCVLVLAWVLLPPVNRLEGPTYGRDDLPSLFGLVDAVGCDVDAPPVDAIFIDPGYNAFIGRFGLGRQRVLGIGLALWQVLEPRERVALIAHELAHEVNGDPARSVLIWSAERTLDGWIQSLSPEESFIHRSDVGTDVGLGLARQFMLLGAWLLSLVRRGLVILHMQRSQEAEYYADLLAVRTAGYDAEHGSSMKLVLRPAVERLLVRGPVAREGAGRALMASLKEKLATTPPEAVARLETRMREERSSIDASHPPTVYRLRFIERHRDLPGTFDAGAVDWAAIDGEMEPFLEPMGQALLEEPWRL